MIQSKIFHVIVIFFTVAIVEKAQEAFSKRKYIPDYYITMSKTVNNKFESTQTATANTLRDSFST